VNFKKYHFSTSKNKVEDPNTVKPVGNILQFFRRMGKAILGPSRKEIIEAEAKAKEASAEYQQSIKDLNRALSNRNFLVLLDEHENYYYYYHLLDIEDKRKKML